MIARQSRASIRLFLAIILTALLSACASIPLSTMWKLRSFDGKDLQALNPTDIRVVVKLPKKLQFKPDQTTLDITVVPKDPNQETLHEHASLTLLNQGRFVPADVPVANPGDVLYLMKLNPDGVRSFEDFQQKLNPDVGHYYKSSAFNVHVNFADSNQSDFAGSTLSVWLRMKRDDDYFPLLENASLASM
jgi:hypothetical protein